MLCAGRVEIRKNQLRLVAALRSADVPVVLVGREGAPRGYPGRVRAAMKETDLILAEVGQIELGRMYAAARVHALPSLYDTPGLASLEAGAMGCNLVMSDIGCQREYFGDLVEYCDAYSVDSIRHSVVRALDRPWPNNALSDRIRSRFTWSQAAEQTLSAYLRLLDQRRTEGPE